MTTQEFFDLLKNNQGKSLVFEYKTNLFVGANYHITEVKHIQVDSVDCGTGTDSWNETIIQLWESPSETEKTEYLSVYKALGILSKVNKKRTFDMAAELKIEYSNDTFHTAQLFINDFEIQGQNLIIKLAIEKTDCKAKDVCGIPEVAVIEGSSCAAGSGCC